MCQRCAVKGKLVKMIHSFRLDHIVEDDEGRVIAVPFCLDCEVRNRQEEWVCWATEQRETNGKIYPTLESVKRDQAYQEKKAKENWADRTKAIQEAAYPRPNPWAGYKLLKDTRVINGIEYVIAVNKEKKSEEKPEPAYSQTGDDSCSSSADSWTLIEETGDDSPEQRREPVHSLTEEDAPVILRRVPWKDVAYWMAHRCVVTVAAPDDYVPEGPHHLPVTIGSEIRLTNLFKGWVLGHAVKDRTRTEGWCPIDKLCIWAVNEPFAPQPDWFNHAAFLELRLDDNLLLHKRYTGEWQDWGFGALWGNGRVAEGLFPLSHATPHVLLTREPERRHVVL